MEECFEYVKCTKPKEGLNDGDVMSLWREDAPLAAKASGQRGSLHKYGAVRLRPQDQKSEECLFVVEIRGRGEIGLRSDMCAGRYLAEVSGKLRLVDFWYFWKISDLPSGHWSCSDVIISTPDERFRLNIGLRREGRMPGLGERGLVSRRSIDLDDLGYPPEVIFAGVVDENRSLKMKLELVERQVAILRKSMEKRPRTRVKNIILGMVLGGGISFAVISKR
ncbi:hypothetical protein BSKO_08996 [Bryopsis sp. KO-2023]|nr:hypothetical protein BSKO_08996 [Bryopsis sp. KO-2023]